MTKLRVSLDLALPEDTVTSTLVVYGGKGMGKTNFGSVLVEELTKAHLRWCALDPMGVWYGLRHSADGKGPGIEHVVLGGPHADLPILPTGGGVVADFVVDETVNVVIDFSRKPSGEMWSIGEKVRFVTDYALRLFQRQGELVDGRRRPPLLQLLDEAARYVPQIIPSGNPELARSVGAWEQLAEEGRNVGLGVAFLTQRSARLNKSVAELADAMLAFRTVGPNSLGAVMDWMGEHVEKKHIAELAQQVRSLEVGQALVVSPGWLRYEGVVRIRTRETFDSSRTIRVGERGPRIHGKGAEPPDLDKYRTRMAETIEKAKADDPKALRAKVRALEDENERLLRKSAERVSVSMQPTKVQRVEVPVLRNGEANRLALAASKLEVLAGRMEKVAQEALAAAHSVHAPAVQVIGELERVVKAQSANTAGVTSRVAPMGAVSTEGRPRGSNVAPAVRAAARTPLARGTGPAIGRRSSPPSTDLGNGQKVTMPQQRILDALATMESIGVETPTRVQLGIWTKYKASGGAFRNNLGALRSAGLVQYPADERVALTDEGRAIAQPQPAPTTEELHDLAFSIVTGPQRQILGTVIEAYPEPLTREELAQRTGYEASGGAFRNNLGALRSAGFIDYPGDGLVAALPVLFVEER